MTLHQEIAQPIAERMGRSPRQVLLVLRDTVAKALMDFYRPEKRYMHGRGPKCHPKQEGG